jgi:lipopolysaccharide transport system permease protein
VPGQTEQQVARVAPRLGPAGFERVPVEQRRHTTIRPTRRWASLDLREAWDYRELLFFLVWRDIKVRYKQTVLGASWALIQPFTTMVVFSIVLGHLAKVPSEGKPYPLFVFSGLVVWTFFSSALAGASNSLAGSGGLISKVYFPRLILPVAAAGGVFVDLLLALGLLGAIMAWYGVAPVLAIFLLPLFVLLALATALACGIWLGALNVRYRDVRAVVPFLTQLWLFASPVAYAATLVPSNWRTVYGLNPMGTAIEGARWALVGTPAPSLGMSLASVLIVVALGVGALAYFKKVERTFADVI